MYIYIYIDIDTDKDIDRCMYMRHTKKDTVGSSCKGGETQPTAPAEWQCVAVCCSVLQYVAVCCSVLHCVAVF